MCQYDKRLKDFKVIKFTYFCIYIMKISSFKRGIKGQKQNKLTVSNISIGIDFRPKHRPNFHQYFPV